MHTTTEYSVLENLIETLEDQSIALMETDIEQSVALKSQALAKRMQIDEMWLEDEEEKRTEFESLKARVTTLEDELTAAKKKIEDLEKDVEDLKAAAAPPPPPPA